MVKWPVLVASERADGESEGESIVVLATIVTAQIPITVIPIPDEGLYRVAGTTVLLRICSAQPACDWLNFAFHPETLLPASNEKGSGGGKTSLTFI